METRKHSYTSEADGERTRMADSDTEDEDMLPLDLPNPQSREAPYSEFKSLCLRPKVLMANVKRIVAKL